MREILFRGKRIDSKEWIYGGLILTQHRAFIVDRENKESLRGFTTHHADMYDWRSTEVVPPTVGQYTDLTDKNGVQIFEGDIVTGKFDHEMIIGHIFYGSDATFFIQRDGLFGIGLNNAPDWVEAIGNIYDNPELAGKEDKP